MSHTEFRTFASLILGYAEQKPTQLACAFVESKNKVELNYGELAQKIKQRASLLLEHNLQGQPVALIFPAGHEFVIDFIACLYAGAIAVPLNLSRNKQQFERTFDVIEDANVKAILTTAKTRPFLCSSLNDISGNAEKLIWLDETCLAEKNITPSENVSKKDLAFIQYTSGSTSKPKGVMVSQGNIIANQKAIKDACGHEMGSVHGGWLPQFHDMGLIGHLMHPLYLGGTYVAMPAMNFVQRPRRWLELITEYKIHSSASPNFGFEHCVKFISNDDDLSGLDLSSWKVAINGSEPVNRKTMQAFSEKFAPCGFDAKSFFPSFGMAETTLFVSGGKPSSGATVQGLDSKKFEAGYVKFSTDNNAKHAVSCGHISPYFNVKIVNPDTKIACLPEQIGEIWIQGDSVTQGYWNNPEKTAQDFKAEIVGGDGSYYLRTGDMGFIHNNELYVTGRIKEMIIIRGRNLYPYDIERSCNEDERASGNTAVFAIEKNEAEGLGAIVEVKKNVLMKMDMDEMARDIKAAVMSAHNVNIDELMLVKPGTIPRTTSGKLRRVKCKDIIMQSLAEAAN